MKSAMALKSKSRLRRIFLRTIFTALAIFIIVVISFSLWIELELKNICEEATKNYTGDKVEVLMMSLETDTYGLDTQLYKKNNRIVWALGQLGDKRALPFLNNLATGKPCDHKTNLCQGEIQEAIRKLEADKFNLPKFLWRGILNY